MSKYPTSWRAFARDVRGGQEKLLVRLSEFSDSILVTGCQRSGSTMLSRLLTQSEGMKNYWFGKDDELDAALILSGCVPHSVNGRYCFQTTYINERYPEYLEHLGAFKMIWSLRNPYSVVFSMVYNWKVFALNELFLSCGYTYMDHVDRVRFQRFGLWSIPRIRRAAYAYVGKLHQLFELRPEFSQRDLSILEYDELVQKKTIIVPRLYEKLSIKYQRSNADSISERSLDKRDNLSTGEKNEVDRLCSEAFERARLLINMDARS
jgi:hypothetical protein